MQRSYGSASGPASGAGHTRAVGNGGRLLDDGPAASLAFGMRCPDCNTEGAGAYCAQCGAPLKGAACRRCTSPLPSGARFCNACGRAVRDVRGRLPWFVAAGSGLGLVLALAVLLAPSQRSSGGVPEGAGPGPGFGGGFVAGEMQAGPLTGTLREQADRLFNRVMQALAAGDTAEARFFLPMAIQAYDNVDGLDPDGLYHVAVLQLAAGDAAAALETAELILAEAPDHLLALGAALEATTELGAADRARHHGERLLTAYDEGLRAPRPEYRHHESILPLYRQTARDLLGR